MSQAGRSQRPRRVDPTRVAGADHTFPAREEVLFGKFKLACTLVLALSTPSFAADAPGVTATEIKIGGVFPFSGPASSIGLVGKGVMAYIGASRAGARVSMNLLGRKRLTA